MFARAGAAHERLALLLDGFGVAAKLAAQAIVEGAILARYQYLLRKNTPSPMALRELTVVSAAGDAELKEGIEKGGIASRAVELARDLAAAPGGLLTARRLAEISKSLAANCGLEVEVLDEKKLLELGCGGMLGVNAGSVEPPRMIKLTYKPQGKSTGNVSLIAKGIMFDAGGLGLKPNNEVHATMKGDMSGAAAVLAAMTSLKALGCTTTVTGYLMCTDNMPSGTALKLGDVITIRGGTTVEVINPDAEGRLVMADGLVLATEQKPQPDAIVDIATLTGACQRALGGLCAGVMGNNRQPGRASARCGQADRRDRLAAAARAEVSRRAQLGARRPQERRRRQRRCDHGGAVSRGVRRPGFRGRISTSRAPHASSPTRPGARRDRRASARACSSTS